MNVWQPIASSPKDGTVILVVDDGDIRAVAWKDFLGKFTGIGGSVFNWCDNPTHWMPLPEPPDGSR